MTITYEGWLFAVAVGQFVVLLGALVYVTRRDRPRR